MTSSSVETVGRPRAVDWEQSAHQPQEDHRYAMGNTRAGTAATAVHRAYYPAVGPAAGSPASAAAAALSARPTGLDIPTSARLAAVDASTQPTTPPAPWSQMAESNAMNEQAASLVGVSIGREQTRMASPTTPSAEKSAALDRTNSWGFFDGTVEEREQLERIREDGREAQGRDREREHAQAQAQAQVQVQAQALHHQINTPPSPDGAGLRLHEISKDKTRSRGNSLLNASLPDINVKQIWHSFNASSLSDALHKLTPLSAPKDGQVPDKARSRSNSNSLFAHRKTWTSVVRKDGNSSPGRANRSVSNSNLQTPTLQPSPFMSRPESNEITPRTASPDRLDATSSQSDSSQGHTMDGSYDSDRTFTSIIAEGEPDRRTSKDDSSGTERRVSRPSLRRTASDGSMLSRASTVYSFDAMNDRFANIDNMVNSRFKAVKDSWQDSAFRLKNVTSNRRLSLMPDFLKHSDDGSSISWPLSGFFGDSNQQQQIQEQKTRSITPPESPKMSRHPALDKALEQLTGDVVLMGGYRGSVLRSAEPPHRQVWVPIKVGLNVRKVNLEMGLYPEDEETEHERIFASGILSHIGPIDISRRLIRRFKQSSNVRTGKVRFHDYGYDWRLSPELLGRKLIEFLEGLPCNQPNVEVSQRGATIIAHSLGGLITRWAVNQRPELFAGVIFAGTPQHCVNILGPLRNGDDVLLSSRVLTAQVNFTLRTSFALLPETGRCFMDKETGEEYRVDFFDPKQWEEYRWSPCVGYPLPTMTESRPGRSNSIMATIRDSVPSLPSLTPKSTSSFSNSNNTNTNGSSPPSSQHQNSEDSTASALRTAEGEVERKAADVAHPTQQTINPTMQPPPVSGPARAVTIPHDQAMEYLTRTLADTIQFKRGLSHNVDHENANAYPPFSVLYATCVPTVYGAKVSGRDGIKRADAYDNLVFAAGDGVVLARASMLPRGYKVAEGGRVQTTRGHVGLLGDLEAVGKCLLSVTEARRAGVGINDTK